MTQAEFLALIISVILTLAVAAVICWCIFGKKKQQQKGDYGKKTVRGILKKYSALRNFKVLTGVTVTGANRTAYFENVLVGFFGILAITTVNHTDAVYGSRKDERWTRVTADKNGENETRQQVTNEVLEGENRLGVLREVLSKNKIYNMQMEHKVVFTVKKRRSEGQMFISGCPEVMWLKELNPMLHKVKYDKDNNVDVDSVVAAIEANGTVMQK